MDEITENLITLASLWVNWDARRQYFYNTSAVYYYSSLFCKSKVKIMGEVKDPGARFTKVLFARNSNSMETSSCCNSAAGDQIATNFCTCHDSTAVVPCTKICSDHRIRIEVRVKQNFHQIWIAMEKLLVKRGPGHLLNPTPHRLISFPCQSDYPFLRYGYFEIWSWKSKVKVTGDQTKSNSYIDIVYLTGSWTLADKKNE